MAKKKQVIIIAACVLLVVGGFTAKYLLDHVFVTYDALDKSKLTENERVFYKDFYNKNPELISKGKLYDVKLDYYMANAPLESHVIAVKKTSSAIKNISWEIHYQKNNQDEKYVYDMDYQDTNIYIEDILLRSFSSQIFDEESLEYPQVDLQDLRIVIRYPGLDNIVVKVDSILGI